MDGEMKSQSRVDSKDKCAIKAKSQGYVKTLLLRITRIWPLKYVFKILQKMASFAGLSFEVENIGAVGQTSPNERRFLFGKKRIGRLSRIILFITPHRLQCALGFHAAESLGQSTSSDATEIKKSPLKPCGKGNKRKQEDLDLEEQHSWVTFMTEDLPDEDQDDDPTYEPSKSDTDSEEQHSKNETESDIEIEEKDGVVMIKEHVEKREEDLSDKEETHGDQQTNRGEPNPDSNVQKTDGGDQEAVSSAATEIKKSPLKPCGKGNKRKQEDLDLEEQHSWVTFMTEDLPDEDQDDDPTYEPSKSDTDSEEHHSKNETESDIEIEEKDGVVMIKEHVENREEDLSNKEETQGDQQTNRGEPNPDGNVQKTDGGDQEAVSSAGTL